MGLVGVQKRGMLTINEMTVRYMRQKRTVRCLKKKRRELKYEKGDMLD